jgi:RES domain-containing protein
MIVYRINNSKYNNSITGEGAFLFGGRWNKVETYMLYTSSSISLAALEILVNTPRNYLQKDYILLKIKIPDQYCIKIEVNKLDKNWKDDIDYCQKIGDDFVKDKNLLSAMVPSSVIQEENNIIIKPTHTFFKQIEIIEKTAFDFDKRLLNR